jgi:hypothetical protein
MDDDFLSEQVIKLESGSRKAVATFRHYQKGWEIYLIKEEGRADTGDSDSLFPTLELAVAEAKRMLA